MNINYPIKFEPILKEKYGRRKISQKIKQTIKLDVGESWEISDVKGDTSIVVNGELKGKSLQEFIKIYGASLMGENIYEHFGNKFPLLIKFIDAKQL